MEGQLSLFDNQDNNEQEKFKVIEGNSLDNWEQLKCYQHELKGVEYKTLEGLFSGFRRLRNRG